MNKTSQFYISFGISYIVGEINFSLTIFFIKERMNTK